MLRIEVTPFAYWKVSPLQWAFVTFAVLLAAFFLWAATLSSLTFNPMILGEAAVLLAVALAVERLWFVLPLMIPNIAFSHSRGVWLSAALGIAAIYVRKPLLYLTAVLALGLFFVLWPFPSDNERLRIWSVAIAYLTPFGNGLGSFNELYLNYQGQLLHPEHVHNDYLQLVFELGI